MPEQQKNDEFSMAAPNFGDNSNPGFMPPGADMAW